MRPGDLVGRKGDYMNHLDTLPMFVSPPDRPSEKVEHQDSFWRRDVFIVLDINDDYLYLLTPEGTGWGHRNYFKMMRWTGE
jgi:hypothetical protein